MKATRWLGLAVTAGVLGGTLGCAQTSTTASAPAPAIPQLQTPVSGTLAPDKLIIDNQKLMVNGQAMSVDQVRKQLPSRISAADAAKMLVQIDPNKIVKETAKSEQKTQIWWGGGLWGRGFWGGYGLYGAGLYGYGGYGYYPYYGYYWPYYSYAGYYYPYSYASYYYPYLYGYGGLYYPYYYRWW
ncbi:hypothetical protein D3C86_1535670 [compost metagenome]